MGEEAGEEREKEEWEEGEEGEEGVRTKKLEERGMKEEASREGEGRRERERDMKP